MLFNDERVTNAVLSFLRKARVGQMITISPRGGGGEEEERAEAEVGGRRGGQGPPLGIAEREGPDEGAASRERDGPGFWVWGFW